MNHNDDDHDLFEEDGSTREGGWHDQEEEPEEGGGIFNQWPLGLIAAGLIALLLLGAGGYGVIEQRAAMQEEIRGLQATLATATSREEVAAAREALAQSEQRGRELQDRLDSLDLENRRLTDAVADLETRLQTLQEAAKKAAGQPATSRPALEEDTTAAGWFVNFGSYSEQATAQQWFERIKPARGSVVLSTGNRDGARFHRVRVVGLASRAEAEKVARQLEREYGLSRLWVGRQ